METENKYYYSKIDTESRKYYSLNFLYAKFYNTQAKEEDIMVEIPNYMIEEDSEVYQSSRFVTSPFYKKKTTIIK